MMEKWTVGLKSVSERTFNANTIFNEDGDGVCSVFGIPMHCTLEEILRSRNSSDAEGLKRAFLIAAAPDLHETLEAVKRWFDDWNVECGPAEEALFETIDTALAKAKIPSR